MSSNPPVDGTISRRHLLRVVGLGTVGLSGVGPSASAAAAASAPAAVATPATPVPAAVDAAQAGRDMLEALTAHEADMLDAIVARLIPTDANGPGATEARAVRYIDRSLAGALKEQREAYRAGLAALDRYAVSSRGKAFTALSTGDQDSVLIDVETGSATGAGAGFSGSSAAFFALLRGHTWQGTFGDPYYGGNAGFVGWDLLGYPGIRLAVAPEDQRLGARPTPQRQSAYATDMFHKG